MSEWGDKDGGGWTDLALAVFVILCILGMIWVAAEG